MPVRAVILDYIGLLVLLPLCSPITPSFSLPSPAGVNNACYSPIAQFKAGQSMSGVEGGLGLQAFYGEISTKIKKSWSALLSSPNNKGM